MTGRGIVGRAISGSALAIRGGAAGFRQILRVAETLLMLAQETLELSRTIRPAANIAKAIASAEPEIALRKRYPVRSWTEMRFPRSKSQAKSVDEIRSSSAKRWRELMVRQGKPDDARKVYIQLSRLQSGTGMNIFGNVFKHYMSQFKFIIVIARNIRRPKGAECSEAIR